MLPFGSKTSVVCSIFLIYSSSLLFVLGVLVPGEVPGNEVAEPCISCNLANVMNEVNISLEELRRARIEYIKGQILQKLRLKKPPQVTKPVLPDLLLSGRLLSRSEEEEEDNDRRFSREDFYGTTQEVVIFPDNTSTHNCYTRDATQPNSCFRFRLTRDVTTRSITSADLWVYKVGDDNDVVQMNNETTSLNHTYTILEVVPHHRGGEGFSKRVVAMKDTSSLPGWLKFELGPAVRTWALRKHMAHALEISCTGCEAALESPVSVDDNQKPFIIVYTNPWNTHSRKRRGLACRDHTTQCCKENFKVNFSDIGWNEWIIQPESYEANFCRGSCLTDVSASRYYHTTVLRRYIQRHSTADSNVTLALCCHPTRMTPLTLIYIDEHKNIFKTALPNMIVESCDCA